jgi:hypothetical protein
MTSRPEAITTRRRRIFYEVVRQPLPSRAQSQDSELGLRVRIMTLVAFLLLLLLLLADNGCGTLNSRRRSLDEDSILVT